MPLPGKPLGRSQPIPRRTDPNPGGVNGRRRREETDEVTPEAGEKVAAPEPGKALQEETSGPPTTRGRAGRKRSPAAKNMGGNTEVGEGEVPEAMQDDTELPGVCPEVAKALKPHLTEWSEDDEPAADESGSEPEPRRRGRGESTTEESEPQEDSETSAEETGGDPLEERSETTGGRRPNLGEESAAESQASSEAAKATPKRPGKVVTVTGYEARLKRGPWRYPVAVEVWGRWMVSLAGRSPGSLMTTFRAMLEETDLPRKGVAVSAVSNTTRSKAARRTLATDLKEYSMEKQDGGSIELKALDEAGADNSDGIVKTLEDIVAACADHGATRTETEAVVAAVMGVQEAKAGTAVGAIIQRKGWPMSKGLRFAAKCLPAGAGLDNIGNKKSRETWEGMLSAPWYHGWAAKAPRGIFMSRIIRHTAARTREALERNSRYDTLPEGLERAADQAEQLEIQEVQRQELARAKYAAEARERAVRAPSRSPGRTTTKTTAITWKEAERDQTGTKPAGGRARPTGMEMGSRRPPAAAVETLGREILKVTDQLLSKELQKVTGQKSKEGVIAAVEKMGARFGAASTETAAASLRRDMKRAADRLNREEIVATIDKAGAKIGTATLAVAKLKDEVKAELARHRATKNPTELGTQPEAARSKPTRVTTRDTAGPSVTYERRKESNATADDESEPETIALDDSEEESSVDILDPGEGSRKRKPTAADQDDGGGGAKRARRSGRGAGIILIQDVGHFEPNPPPGHRGLDSVNELIANIEALQERRGLRESTCEAIVEETLRGEALEWWRGSAAAAARSTGWATTVKALQKRFGDRTQSGGSTVAVVRRMAKPAAWGSIIKRVGSSANIIHIPGAAAMEATRREEARPRLSLQPKGATEEEDQDVAFTLDARRPWSHITENDLAIFKRCKAEVGKVTVKWGGRETEAILIHAENAQIGEFLLRAVVTTEDKSTMGAVDQEHYKLHYIPRTDHIRSEWHEREVEATWEINEGGNTDRSEGLPDFA